MPRMTEEEAWALDDEVTKNPPRVDPSKARHVSRMATRRKKWLFCVSERLKNLKNIFIFYA